MKYVVVTMALIAAILGIALRSVELFNQNYVFVYDQGLDMLAARSIAVDHKMTLIGAEAGGGFAGLPGIFHGPGYHYLLAFVSLFSKGDPYGAMVFLWITQIVGLGLIYILGKRVIGFWGGVVSTFVAAVSPVFIGMTRVIWAPNFAGLGILLYFYVLLTIRHKKFSHALLLGFVSSGLYHFEIPIAVAGLLSSCVYLLVVEKIRSVSTLASFVLGSIFGVIPMIAFDARHGWTMVQGVIGFITHPVVVTKSGSVDVIGHVQTILFHINGIFPSIQSLPYWFWFVTIAVGTWLLFRGDKKEERRRIVHALLITFYVHIALFVLYRNPIYGHYLTLLSYTCVMIVGYLGQRIMEVRKEWLLVVFISVLAVPAILLYPRTIIADYYDDGGTAKIRGKKAAIDFIYTDAQGKPFNVLIFSPPVYTYPYDYILQWYAQHTYGYLPKYEKQGTFYLLIEPDSDKPWSYNGWLETVIQTGIVEKTWKLPSGFIIEKRVESSL